MNYESVDSAIFISFSVFLSPLIRNDLNAAQSLLKKFNLFFSNGGSEKRQLIQKSIKFYNESSSICSFIPLTQQNFIGNFFSK
jgi:hypothetical protein